jgi:nucleoside-diphosphate-sugar epimerase
LKSIVDRETGAIFHLAAIVSGMAEADFDLGMRINVDATRTLLELCREAGNRPRVVFTSSVAVFGGDLPPLLNDATPLNPQTSYGIEKAIGDSWSRITRGRDSSTADRCGCRRSPSGPAAPTPPPRRLPAASSASR